MAPRRIAPSTSTEVLHAAIAGNLLVAGTKIGAAVWTGSSVMLSEAVHSVVDSGNSVLLLHGLRRARRRPDHDHPLGFGREIFFWSFVVAVLIFALGAGVSLYEGIAHIRHPRPIRDVGVGYAVLAVSALIDGTTWWIAFSNFKGRGSLIDIFGAVHASKDPPSFMALFEDSAGLIGLAVAVVGTWSAVHWDMPELDGVGSILIGLLLAATSILLTRETKGQLIGEGADQLIAAALPKIAEDMDGVAHANGILTVHLAPRQIIFALSLEFADDLKTPEIEIEVAELEDRLRAGHPEIVAAFVKPQSAAGYAATLRRRFGAPHRP